MIVYRKQKVVEFLKKLEEFFMGRTLDLIFVNFKWLLFISIRVWVWAWYI